MPSLADTIARLSELRGNLGLSGYPPTHDRLSDMDDFGSNPGKLRARTYVPEDVRRSPGLVVVLHGCTQSASAYDHSAGWSAMADRYGFVLLFPEQRRANNPNLCFNWFAPAHNRRGQGEALSIAQMIKTMIVRHGIDVDNVFVSGLSAGGAMASAMLATYPELFAGGTIIAGLPYGLASSVREAFEVMGGQIEADSETLGNQVLAASGHLGPWPKISVWHGAEDRTVDVRNAAAIVDQWKKVHGTTREPSNISTIEGFARRVWQDSNGWDAIEEFIIPGMAHGVPLDTSADDNGEVSSPYMLDVGISSTREAIRFWGLSEAGEPHWKRRITKKDPQAVPLPRTTTQYSEAIPKGRGDPSLSRRRSLGVQDVIEDALRSAGLMK